jgi:co-chaperonin GroES (HSP10)
MMEQANKSGIHPIGDRVLIAPEEVEEVSSGGIVIHTMNQMEKEQMAQTFGVVAEIGPDCWPGVAPKPVSIGERVVFGKYSGMVFKGLDGIEYRLLRAEMIHSKVDKGVRNV